jgi:hypothetical protein
MRSRAQSGKLRKSFSRSGILLFRGNDHERLGIRNLLYLMAAILLKKKYRYARTWIIEGFDGTTCFFKQTLSETFLPDARIVVLLQRLLSQHLIPKDIIDGSTTLRDPLHSPIFGARREIVEGGVSITVGENPYYVATRMRRPYKNRQKS